MARVGDDTDAVCPLLDEEDPRCVRHLGINGLDWAFAYCFGAFHRCPVYHDIQWERVEVTVRGHTVSPQAVR